ncbi:MAG TPA: hypothetical protein VGC54_09275 [Planctomycetota bacterium]
MVSEPTTPPSVSQRRQLEQEWQAALAVFRAFRSVPPARRFHHLGLVFESLSHWIERAIRTVALRHFLLLPSEMVLARIFAKAARRRELHPGHEAFALWVESLILRDLADPTDELGAVNGAAGEPSARLQLHFNGLPYRERALLYLYMVERYSLREVADRTGMPAAEAAAQLNRVWDRIAHDDPGVQLPLGWRAPDNPLGPPKSDTAGLREDPAEGPHETDAEGPR